MIKLYGQNGLINIVNGTEFFNIFCEVEHVDKIANYPKIETIDISGGLDTDFHDTYKIVNVKYNLEDNVRFNRDNYIENCTHIDDVVCKMIEDGAYGHIITVLVGDTFYFYSKPVMIKNGSNYEIVCMNLHKNYSCGIEKLDIQGTRKVRATKLAVKMYPHACRIGDYLIVGL